MKQATKKELAKRKPKIGVNFHSEGKHLCDCLTRGWRLWLGIKLYGWD